MGLASFGGDPVVRGDERDAQWTAAMEQFARVKPKNPW